MLITMKMSWNTTIQARRRSRGGGAVVLIGKKTKLDPEIL
jgi:hypothetical protein